MKKIKNSHERLAIFAGVILLVLGVGILIWINFIKQNNWLHNDSAAELALSKLLSEEGGILSRNWYYSTELRLLYTQLVYAPLFRIFEDWSTVHAIGNMILNFIMIISYVFFARQLSIKRHLIIFTLPFLLFMPSMPVLLMIGTDTFYIPHIVLGFFYLGIYMKCCTIKSNTKLNQLLYSGIYLLLSLLCGLSGTRYLMNIQAPLLLAAILLFGWSDDLKILRKDFTLSNYKKTVKSTSVQKVILSIAGTAIALIGYLVNTKVLQQIYNFQSYNEKIFRDIDSEFMADIGLALNGLLSLMGYRLNAKVFSLAGICNLGVFVIFIILLFIIVRRILIRKNSLNEAQLLITLYFLCSLIVGFFIAVMTKEIVERYFIPVIIFYIPLVAIYLNEQGGYKLDKIFWSSALVCLLILTTSLTVSGYSKQNNIPLIHNSEAKQGAADFLVENGYTFGYATFWNSDVITYLTNGHIEVAHINDPQSMTAFRWLSQKKYYEPGYHSSKVFLLLSEEERLTYESEPVILEGAQVYQDTNFTIYSYDSNVLEHYIQQ